jgi:hypothetical protein
MPIDGGGAGKYDAGVVPERWPSGRRRGTGNAEVQHIHIALIQKTPRKQVIFREAIVPPDNLPTTFSTES